MQLPNISFRFPRVRSETSKKRSSTRVRVSMPVPEPAAPPFPTVHHGFSEEDKTQTTSPSPPTTSTTADSDYEGTFSEETHTDDEEEEEQEEEEENNTFVPPAPSSGVSFFQGASNYQITGSTFTVINGNGRVTQHVASNPGGGGASPSGSSPSGSGISFGNDWPFGPNNDPFAQGATSARARTTPSSAHAGRRRPSEANSRGSGMDAPRTRARARNQHASSSQRGGVFFSMTQTDNNSNRRVTEYTFDQLAADGFAHDNINTLWVGGRMYVNGVCVIDTNT